VKNHFVHKSRVGGIPDREWDENVPDAVLEISSADGIRFDRQFPKYVKIQQEDNYDEYYEQSIVVREEDAIKIIELLKQEFYLE